MTELLNQPPIESDEPLAEVAEQSPARRLVNASTEIFGSIVKIVLNGNGGEAVRESANHL